MNYNVIIAQVSTLITELVILRCCYFYYDVVFLCLTADGPQRAGLSIAPTATLLSCLWTRRILPSLTGSRLMIVYRDASSALLQLVNQFQWLNFPYPCPHAFHYRRNSTTSGFHKNRIHNFRTSRCSWLPTRPLNKLRVDEERHKIWFWPSTYQVSLTAND